MSEINLNRNTNLPSTEQTSTATEKKEEKIVDLEKIEEKKISTSRKFVFYLIVDILLLIVVFGQIAYLVYSLINK